MRFLFLLLILLKSGVGFCQSFDSEFQRLSYIQNLETISQLIQDKNSINFNTVFLDSTQLGDYNFVNSVTNMGDNHREHFLISGFNSSSYLGDKVAPACMIIINYNNRFVFNLHAKRYEKIMGEKKALEFVNYMLVSHEIGHCLARYTLGVNAVAENYADAIASFLIKNSEYSSYVSLWIDNLKLNSSSHNTYNYVLQFYQKTKDYQNLKDILELLKKNNG